MICYVWHTFWSKPWNLTQKQELSLCSQEKLEGCFSCGYIYIFWPCLLHHNSAVFLFFLFFHRQGGLCWRRWYVQRNHTWPYLPYTVWLRCRPRPSRQDSDTLQPPCRHHSCRWALHTEERIKLPSENSFGFVICFFFLLPHPMAAISYIIITDHHIVLICHRAGLKTVSLDTAISQFQGEFKATPTVVEKERSLFVSILASPYILLRAH